MHRAIIVESGLIDGLLESSVPELPAASVPRVEQNIGTPRENHVGDPRRSISFITTSLASITMRRRGSCPSWSLGIKTARAASRAAIHAGKLSAWLRKRLLSRG